MELEKSKMYEFILALFMKYGNQEALASSQNIYNSNILTSGFVDSFSITSVIALIEDAYDYSFTSNQLQGDEIRSISGIVNILRRELVDR